MGYEATIGGGDIMVREGAKGINPDDETVVHAVDDDGDPLCGINPNATEPWFKARKGTRSEVTCEDCLEEMEA